MLRVALFAAVLVALAATGTGIYGLLAPAPALASSSTVTVLGGEVLVRRGEGADFRPVADGDLVQSGDVVRTGPDAHAVLTYFDGSIVEVEPGSEIVVRALGATAAGDIVVVMEQTLGRTWHVVARALSANSRYEVRTPTATALVRGTSFDVEVEADGRTSVTTTEGEVAAVGERGDPVAVPAGQRTEVPKGEAPTPPRPAPPPPLSVTVVIDASAAQRGAAPASGAPARPEQRTLLLDPFGRAVGVKGGKPVLYVPGSKVSIADGKVVVTMPMSFFGTVRSVVDVDAGRVDIETQVKLFDQILAEIKEQRAAQGGEAKGGFILGSQGATPLPDDFLRQAPPPKIGAAPPPPQPGPFVRFIAPPGASPFLVSLPPGPVFRAPSFSPPPFSVRPFSFRPGAIPPFGPPPGFSLPPGFSPPAFAPQPFGGPLPPGFSPPPGFVPYRSQRPTFEFTPPPGFSVPPGPLPPRPIGPPAPGFGPSLAPGFTPPFPLPSDVRRLSPPPTFFAPSPSFAPPFTGPSPAFITPQPPPSSPTTFASPAPAFTLPPLPSFGTTPVPFFTSQPRTATPPPLTTPFIATFTPPPATPAPLITAAPIPVTPTPAADTTPLPTPFVAPTLAPTPFPTPLTAPSPTLIVATPPPTLAPTLAPPTLNLGTPKPP